MDASRRENCTILKVIIKLGIVGNCLKIITDINTLLKKNMVSFKNINTKDYGKIKRGLKKLVKITPCPSDDKSIIETFDIVSSGFKFPVTYYKTKTLLVQGDESNKDYKQAIEFIQYSLKIDS